MLAIALAGWKEGRGDACHRPDTGLLYWNKTNPRSVVFSNHPYKRIAATESMTLLPLTNEN
jgi:hypothetical protein